MIRGLIRADCHLEVNKPVDDSYRLFEEFTKDFKPDVLVDLGDLLELSYLASFNKDNLKILGNGQLKKDYDFARTELKRLRKYVGEFWLLEGNHDFRVRRTLEHWPMFEGLVEYPIGLHLEELGIKFKQLDEVPLRIGKLTFIHGYWSVKNIAKKLLDEYGHNVIGGHVHRFDLASKVMAIHEEEIQAWTIGCLSSTSPQWLRGRPNSWQKGFAVFYMDKKTGNFNLFPVNIIDGQFFFGGEKYGQK